MTATARQAMDSHAANASPMLPDLRAPGRSPGAFRATDSGPIGKTLLARCIRLTRRKAGTLSLLAVLAACASHPSTSNPEANDPLESSNRAVFKANDTVDRAVIKWCLSHERENLLNHASKCVIEPGRWVNIVGVCG